MEVEEIRMMMEEEGTPSYRMACKEKAKSSLPPPLSTCSIV